MPSSPANAGGRQLPALPNPITGRTEPPKPVWVAQRLVLRVATGARPLETEVVHLVRLARRRRGRASEAGAQPMPAFLLAETLITFALSALVMVGLVASAAVLMRATDRSVAAVGAADDLGRTLAALSPRRVRA